MFTAEVTSRQSTSVFTVRLENRAVREKRLPRRWGFGKKLFLFDTSWFIFDKKQWSNERFNVKISSDDKCQNATFLIFICLSFSRWSLLQRHVVKTGEKIHFAIESCKIALTRYNNESVCYVMAKQITRRYLLSFLTILRCQLTGLSG